MNGLEELLRERSRQSDDVELPLPEAQIATLREVRARFAAGCTFKPGDIVTPRKGYCLKGAGVPHIVLEVGAPPPPPAWPSVPSDTGSSRFGARLDMRIAAHDGDGDISTWWVESWALEACATRWRTPERPRAALTKEPRS